MQYGEQRSLRAVSNLGSDCSESCERYDMTLLRNHQEHQTETEREGTADLRPRLPYGSATWHLSVPRRLDWAAN